MDKTKIINDTKIWLETRYDEKKENIYFSHQPIYGFTNRALKFTESQYHHKLARTVSLIRTLSAYDFTDNDVYKIWAAERSLNKKTKYLILQHGGNSGLAESAPGTDLHSLLADKYLTWGWKG